MIEKRKMFIVESGLTIKPICAMYDTKIDDVVCYKYSDEDGNVDEDDDWFHKYANEEYFNTEKEAEDYVTNRIKYLRYKAPEVKAYIEEMEGRCKAVGVAKREYLGRYASKEDEYWKGRCEKAEAKLAFLEPIARSRRFNVSGVTICIDDVAQVIWHPDDVATLVMRGGRNVVTSSDAEYKVVELIFGHNMSEKTHPLV